MPTQPSPLLQIWTITNSHTQLLHSPLSPPLMMNSPMPMEATWCFFANQMTSAFPIALGLYPLVNMLDDLDRRTRETIIISGKWLTGSITTITFFKLCFELSYGRSDHPFHRYFLSKLDWGMWSFQYVPGPNLYFEGLPRVHGLSILVRKHAIWNEELPKALCLLPNDTRH